MKKADSYKFGTRVAKPKPWIGLRVQKAVAMLVAVGFLCYPLSSSASGMIGVAKVAGTAERNGMPLHNGGIVSSGDSLSTHQKSALLLSPTPREKLWLGSDTSARLIRKAGNTVIALERGTLGFRSQGHMEISIAGHNVAIRSRNGSPVLAQITFENNQQAQVWLRKGSLEIVQGGEAVLLRAGRSGLISVVDPRSPAERPTREELASKAQSATQTNAGSIKGNVVDTKAFVMTGATVTLISATGKTVTTKTDGNGNFAFDNVTPGTYTLTVSQPGYRTYETRTLVVSSGRVSSVFVQLKGKTNKGLIIGVIAGAGAAAGIGIGVALRGGKKTTVSPSSVP